MPFHTRRVFPRLRLRPFDLAALAVALSIVLLPAPGEAQGAAAATSAARR